jgi:DmsE family decaheme c-type cytochrome
MNSTTVTALRAVIQRRVRGNPGAVASPGGPSIARLCALALAVLLFGLLPLRSALADADPQADARYIGEQKCINCHQLENATYSHTLHAQAFRLNPRNEVEKAVCEACHGPGSLHAANTADKRLLIGYSKEWGTPVARQTAQCLTCHDGGQRINWAGSIHQTKKLSCSDCHNPMSRFSASGLLKKASITETCISCHPQQRAEFSKRSHMPVPEGKMTCEDCHNPHGSTTRRLLKADSVNDLCYTCHAEKRGPYIWEHAPVRENCLNCHEQHGSSNEKLLKQSRPMLCLTCHNHTGGMGHTYRNPQDPAAAIQIRGRACQNCHAQIHGSNSPDGSRWRR